MRFAFVLLLLLAGFASACAGRPVIPDETPVSAPEAVPAPPVEAAPTPVPEPPPPPDPAAAHAHYEAGLAHLKEKRAEAAAAELSACAAKDPARTDCLWELGWAHWLTREWSEVVAAWEEVARRSPEQPDLERYLHEARGQLALKEKLAAAREAAPESVPADVPEGTVLRLRAVGDVMLGTDFPEGYLPPEDGALMLALVAEQLADADLTFINLEGPLCDSGETTKCRKGGNCYAFRSPTRYGRYLAEAGVDLASTANNHSGDFGEACRRETEAALDALGIVWSGPPGSVAKVLRNGLRVSMIAFHTSPACNDVNDQDTAEALVRAVKAESDLVLVSFHGGAEGRNALRIPDGPETFYGENRGDLRRFARGVVDAGADLVIGHGPHVVRGMEVHRDRLIAYSLGNFATYGRFNLSGPLGLGAILEVTLDAQGRFAGGRLLATRQQGQGVPEPDPQAQAVDLVRSLSAEDFPETGVVVGRDGSLSAPGR